MHILIVSKSNLKLEVFGLFSRFVRTLIFKISSSDQKTPWVSTELGMVLNLAYSFIPLKKIWQKRWRTRRSALKTPEWRRTGKILTILAHAQRCPSAAMNTTSSGNMSMISLVAETEHGSVGDQVSVTSFSWRRFESVRSRARKKLPNCKLGPMFDRNNYLTITFPQTCMLDDFH